MSNVSIISPYAVVTTQLNMHADIGVSHTEKQTSSMNDKGRMIE